MIQIYYKKIGYLHSNLQKSLFTFVYLSSIKSKAPRPKDMTTMLTTMINSIILTSTHLYDTSILYNYITIWPVCYSCMAKIVFSNY